MRHTVTDVHAHIPTHRSTYTCVETHTHTYVYTRTQRRNQLFLGLFTLLLITHVLSKLLTGKICIHRFPSTVSTGPTFR